MENSGEIFHSAWGQSHRALWCRSIRFRFDTGIRSWLPRRVGEKRILALCTSKRFKGAAGYESLRSRPIGASKGRDVLTSDSYRR